MNSEHSEHRELSALLSRNEMVKWLYEFLNSDPIKDLEIKITTFEGDHGFNYYCFRCTILQEYIAEMRRRVKVAVLSNIHDSFIVFLNHFITHAAPSDISKKDLDGIFKDLILRMERYEQKTAVAIQRTEFGTFVRRFVNEMIQKIKQKEIWWFVSLYRINEKALPKDIKPPICSYYLVCMSLDTKAAKLEKESDKKARRILKNKIEKKVNKDVADLMNKVEEEDHIPLGILFPVENTIVVDDLKKALEEEERKRKEEEQKRKEEEKKNTKLEEEKAKLIAFMKTKGISDEEIEAILKSK